MDHDGDDDNEARKKPKQAQSVLKEAPLDGLYLIIEYEIEQRETGAKGNDCVVFDPPFAFTCAQPQR